MNNEREEKRWEKIDERIRRQDQKKRGSGQQSGEIMKIPTPEELSHLEQEPRGIIERYKAKKIKKRFTVEALQNWYDGQLEITEEGIRQGVRVKKEEIGRQAEEFLSELDRRHLDFLSEIGLKNVEIRQKALFKLNDQTASMLAELKEKTDSEEWPEVLANESIDAIMKVHRNFFDEILKEEFSFDRE